MPGPRCGLLPAIRATWPPAARGHLPGADPADVGLAWLLHQPGVTAPIIGPRTPRTPAQLDEAVRALQLTLDETALGTLDEIFPGPGGAAPEA